MVLPLPPIMACLFVDQYNYHIHRFPPTLCISYGEMWFYSVTLVLDVLIATGVCLLITIVWVLHQVSFVVVLLLKLTCVKTDKLVPFYMEILFTVIKLSKQ